MSKSKEPNKDKPLVLVKHKGKVHAMKETPFGPMGVPITDTQEDAASICMHNLPLIPLELFYQVLCWQRNLARKHRCETHTSLFLINDQWVAEPFFQENGEGQMTIQVHYNSEENQERFNELCAQSENGVHATIHNHVNMGAGQSGTDHADEMALPGPHITLGNMQQVKVDYHGRFSVMTEGQHHFIPMRLSEIIEMPLPDFASQEQIEAAETLVMSNVPEIGWPKEWDDKFKPKAQKTPAHTGTRSPVHGGGRFSPANRPMGLTTSHQGNTKAVIGNMPLDAAEVEIGSEPWAVIIPMDASAYTDFRTCSEEMAYAKPVAKIMAAHGISLYAVYLTLRQVKEMNNIPLDSSVQAAK